MEKQRIFGLDLLRSIAISAVLFCHAGAFLIPQYPQLRFLNIFFGFLGVELFFVLSGFLIGGILIKQLEENKKSISGFKNFWFRRWFRTLPNYFLFLLINFALAPLLNMPLDNWWKYFFFLQNFAWNNPPFFPESWSLAVEEWFYLIFPITLWITAKFCPSKQSCFLLPITSIFLAATLLRFFYVIYWDPTWDEGVRKTVLFRLDALMYGVFAAFIKRYYFRFWKAYKAILFATGILLLFLAVFLFFNISLDKSLTNRTILFSITSASVFFLLPVLDGWKKGNGPYSNIVTNVSIWSYSLYLCQFPLCLILLRNSNDYLQWHTWVNGVLVIFYLGLSVYIAKLCYLYFERPTTQLREKFT